MVNQYTANELHQHIVGKLAERGVLLANIAEIVHSLQVKYTPDITREECLDHVEAVFKKRETLHAFLVGIELDELAEQGKLTPPLQALVEQDEGLFGIDEIITLSIVNMYGSIGLTTFGYLDKEKVGIIKSLDSKDNGKVNTFLDDLVAGVAAAASSKLAHAVRDKKENSI